MKYAGMVLFGLVVLIGLPASGAAFTFGPEGQGNPYYAPAIPLDEVALSFDGDLSEWTWLPKKFQFSFGNVPRYSAIFDEEGFWPKDDFDVFVYGPAWIPAMNKYAFAVHKVDDVLYGPDENLQACYKEDCMQWCIDPDASAGEYRGENNSRQAQQNFITPNQGGHLGLFGPEELWWEFEEPYCLFGKNVDPATGSYDIEVAITLWDWLDASVETSTEHQLEPDQLIGGTFYVNDVDSEEKGASIGWHFADPWKDANAFAAFYMMSVEDTKAEKAAETAVEQNTWGRVKATFR